MVDKGSQQVQLRAAGARIGALASQQRLAFPRQNFFKALLAFQFTPVSTTALLTYSHPNAGGDRLRFLLHYSSATELL